MNRRIMKRLIAGIGLGVCAGLSMTGCDSDAPTPVRYIDATQFRVVDDARQFWVEGLEWETKTRNNETKHYELKRDNTLGDSYLRAYINGEPSDIVIRPEKDKFYGYDVIKGEEFLMCDYELVRSKPIYPSSEADVYYECFVMDNGRMVTTLRKFIEKENALPRLELLRDRVDAKLFGESYYVREDSNDVFGHTTIWWESTFYVRGNDVEHVSLHLDVVLGTQSYYVDNIGFFIGGDILGVDLSNVGEYVNPYPDAPIQCECHYDGTYYPEIGGMENFSINGKKLFTNDFLPYSWEE